MIRLSTSKVFLCFLFMLTSLRIAVESSGQALGRQKREWIIAPRKLWENEDYTGLEYIAKIRSDKEDSSDVTYHLKGSGATTFPVGLFTVNPVNGFVRIHAKLDREERAFYNLVGEAFYSNGKRAEKDIDLRIVVLDRNDCPPVFSMQQTGSVYESSAANTVVMRVNATDADEAGTPHTQIYYSIVEKSSSDRMFSINYQTGEILVRQTGLDREIKDTYTLTVRGSDMNGESGGLIGTGEVVIKLLDINDNVPTLEKETYEGSVMENTINVEVLRIKAIDLDLEFSDNWLAVFTIVSGNMAGYFTITTDSKTNEGIITIVKALDYEELTVVNLAVSVSNKAEYNFGSSSGGNMGGTAGKTYSVKINVVNQREGPRFRPAIKVVTLSEDKTTISINKVITTYAAIDSDTLLTATNVRYAKILDKDNWLILNEKTAEIRLNKLPDRESEFVINGTYEAKIICITYDVPPQTATGTIAIQVKDFNDHCPTLTSTSQTMCRETNEIYVTAEDKDAAPNGAPFQYQVVQSGAKEKWTIEHINGTTAVLRDNAFLWHGNYKVGLEIKDQQGKVCADVQWLNVVVCTCDSSKSGCVGRLTGVRSTLGPAGVLMMLLGLLLLLLLPLFLLFCLCGQTAALGGFKSIPIDDKGILMCSHTEGQGEDKIIPMLKVPVEVDHGSIKAVDVQKYGGNSFFGLGGGGGGTGGRHEGFTSLSTWDRYGYKDFHHGNGGVEVDGRGTGMGGVNMTGREDSSSWFRGGAYDGIALSDSFLEEYYMTKANHAAHQTQLNDSMLICDNEGQGSPVGSLGCCSLLENDNDLEFLDNLGPKFKTLAEICLGSTLEVEESVEVSVRPPRPTTSAGTHTGTTIDTSVNLNTLNSSSLTSGSSTVIQETVLRERGSATIPRVHVQENVVVPSQTLLIQQPTVYYTAAPAMYVVEPQPQVVLVDARAASGRGHVGMGQGLVQVGGHYGSQPGMLLVERQVGGSGGAHVVTSTGQAVIGGGSVVTGGSHTISGGGQVLHRAGLTTHESGHFSTGSHIPQGSVSRSKHVRVVESGSVAAVGGASAAGLAAAASLGASPADHSLEVRGPYVEVRGQGASSLSTSSQTGFMGSDKDSALMATPGSQSSHTVTMQHKKISVTERNVETTSIA